MEDYFSPIFLKLQIKVLKTVSAMIVSPILLAHSVSYLTMPIAHYSFLPVLIALNIFVLLNKSRSLRLSSSFSILLYYLQIPWMIFFFLIEITICSSSIVVSGHVFPLRTGLSDHQTNQNQHIIITFLNSFDNDRVVNIFAGP